MRLANFISKLQISKNFDKAIICYILNTTESEKVCLLSLANYTEVKTYQSIYQFGKDRTPKVFNFNKKFIYIVDAS